MQILLEIPSYLLDAIQRTPPEFGREAKMAMAAKLYEMKRLSSGMAADLAGVSRVAFLAELHRYDVPVIDLTDEEIESDIKKMPETRSIVINTTPPDCSVRGDGEPGCSEGHVSMRPWGAGWRGCAV